MANGNIQYGKTALLVAALLVVFGSLSGLPNARETSDKDVSSVSTETLADAVIPKDGFVLPIRWNDLGARLVAAGVIDEAAFRALYAGRGGLSVQGETMLSGNYEGQVVINRENEGELLNLLWALGLANANPILEDTDGMRNPAYGGADHFASTGGWTLGSRDLASMYGTQKLVPLTPAEQALVERVSAGIYRPCCGNSTHFPDCNHGMAMLGLLELMASQGANEDTLYRAALAVNSYWFPEQYLAIAQSFKNHGTAWNAVDPKVALGSAYSSAQGFQRVLAETQQSGGGGASCGV